MRFIDKDNCRHTQRHLIAVIVALVSVLMSSPVAQAAPKKNIKCPPIIADRKTGVLRKLKHPSSDARYRCYNETSAAKKDKFVSTNQIGTMNFQGWYRVRLTKVESSCPLVKESTGPVVFAQVLQSNDAAFVDFCPSVGRMTGSRTENGISVSGLDTANEALPAITCSDGNVERSGRFELTRAVQGGSSFIGRYTVTRRCTAPGEEDKVCVTKYSGPAFHETHTIWPPVASKATELNLGCTAALNACSECHPGLTFP